MKYTFEELRAMTQQYSQDKGGKYVAHLAYEEINRQAVEEGVPWNKCQDCGNVYVVGRQKGSTSVHCSSMCEAAAIADIMGTSLSFGEADDCDVNPTRQQFEDWNQ